MKKIHAFFLLVFLISIMGCKKDSPAPVDPPAGDSLWVEVKADRDTIFKGGLVTFTFSSNADSGIVVLSSGEKYKLQTNGTKSFTLNQNTSFAFSFFKDKTTRTRNFTITVSEIVPPTPAPDFDLSADTCYLLNGGITIIHVSNTTNTDYFISDLPGMSGLSGSFPTPYLTDTTTFHFTAYGKGGTKSDSITIIVESVKTNLEIIAYYSPWKLVKWLRKYHEEDPWVEIILGDDWLADRDYFYKNYFFQTFRYGVLISNGHFFIDSLNFTWGNWISKDFSIKSDTFETKAKIPSYPISDSVFIWSFYVPAKE